jgi:hypothetical protein
MMTRVSTNQVTRGMILNIAKIRMKNDTTIMISNLAYKHKLHGQAGNKRNIRNMKRVRTKSVLPNNIERGCINNMKSDGKKKNT